MLLNQPGSKNLNHFFYFLMILFSDFFSDFPKNLDNFGHFIHCLICLHKNNNMI